MKEIELILSEMLEIFKMKDAADDAEIENQENSIKCANSIILDRKKEKEDRKESYAQFQSLLDAVKSKANNDRDALAALYISDKTHDDFEEFSELTGIGLSQESEQSTDKETGEAGATAAA